jgi:hypothetical protein
MKGTNSQKGQALILIAFGIVALIGFTALAVDGGRVFSDRRNAQNAADTSALAAALAHLRNDPAGFEAKGLERALSNGYNNDADSTVSVVFCNTVAGTSDPCVGLPTGANPAEYIRVKITSNVPMTFARVLGREFVTNRVEAITRVQGSPTDNPFTAGAGLYSVRNDNADDCFKVNGSADLTLHDTGIFVNCTGSSALFLNGSADIGMDANAQVAGCTNNINFPISGTGTIDCNVAQQIVNENTFADVPTVLPTPNCTSAAQYNSATNTVSPGADGTGYFNSNLTPSGSITTFQAGTYCFLNGSTIQLTGGKSIKGTGAVKFVMNGGDIDLKGSSNDFDDLEIYANSSDFDLFGTLNSDRFRFFGNGSSNFALNAGAVFTSTDTYIYSETGTIDFNAQASADMHAPPAGDTFAGLLLYMPWDNPNDFELNGGSNNTWYGTVLMPHADVTYNGGAGFKLYGQVIGYTFKINGSGQSDIYFDSNFIYNPPNNPTMDLIK